MSNPSPKSYSIRAMLFLLSLVVLAPTLLIQSYIYYDRFQGRRAREFQANLEVARAVSRAFEAFVQGIVQQEMVIGIAAKASPQMSLLNLNHLLVQCTAGSPAVSHFSLVGPGGRILASNSQADVGLNISDRSYFVQITAGRDWVVSDLLNSDITGQPVFTISRSIRDGKGALLGIVSASVVPDRLDKVLPIERLGDAGISLIDSRGMLVYRYPDNPTGWEARNWRSHHPSIEDAFRGRDTATLTMRSSGRKRLFGFVPISSVGWISAASRDEKESLAPIYSSLIQHAVLFLMVILSAFVASLALARSIAASIDRLRAHALAVGQGEITPAEAASGPSELTELADVFNRMAEKVSLREAALRESENRYRDLVQNANSAIIRIKNDGTIAFFNEYAQRFYGYSAEEVQGKHMSLILPKTDSTGADLSGLVEDVIAHPEQHRSHINENILRDGSRVWMAWTNRPICDEYGRVSEILAIGSDISELKRAEDARRETEERFRSVVHNLTEGLLIHARSGRVIYYNPASLRLYGFDGQWAELAEGEASSIWEITDLQGRIIPFQRWMHYEVLRGKRFQNVLAHVRRKDGGREFWGSFNGVPIYDQDGTVKFALITMRDESARMRAEEELREINRRLEHIVQERTALLAKTIEELKLANQQLDARANQLAALTGELTMTEQRERKRLAKILHDGLQQHLAATKMQLGAILLTNNPQDLCMELSEIEAKLDESIRMSRSLSADLSPPALHEGGLIAGLEWLARRMRERYDFRVDLMIGEHPELSEEVNILVFESVRELLFNAFKHARVNAAKVLLQPLDGAGIEICVSDQGIGFDPARLIASGETGGGFGLFSIRERLGLIGGTLKIDSAPRKGSCFTLSLPYSSKVGAAVDVSIFKPIESDRPPGPTRPPIRVLLADDHTLFRDGIARLLGKERDITIVGQAKNGREAVEMARRLTPQVILMDINMPLLNGIEATRIIHRESPSVRIIGLSMHEEEERAEAMHAAGAVGYKSKTCPVAELIEAVRGAVAEELPDS